MRLCDAIGTSAADGQRSRDLRKSRAGSQACYFRRPFAQQTLVFNTGSLMAQQLQLSSDVECIDRAPDNGENGAGRTNEAGGDHHWQLGHSAGYNPVLRSLRIKPVFLQAELAACKKKMAEKGLM